MQMIVLYSESIDPLYKIEEKYFVFSYLRIYTTEILVTSVYYPNHYYFKKRINLSGTLPPAFIMNLQNAHQLHKDKKECVYLKALVNHS